MQRTQYKDIERQSWQQIRLVLGSVKQLWPKQHPALLLSLLSCETWRTVRTNRHRISQNSGSRPSMSLSVEAREARKGPGQFFFPPEKLFDHGCAMTKVPFGSCVCLCLQTKIIFSQRYQPQWMSSLFPSKVICCCKGISVHQSPNTNTIGEWQTPATSRRPEGPLTAALETPGPPRAAAFLVSPPSWDPIAEVSECTLSLWRGEPTWLLEVCPGPHRCLFQICHLICFLRGSW